MNDLSLLQECQLAERGAADLNNEELVGEKKKEMPAMQERIPYSRNGGGHKGQDSP